MSAALTHVVFEVSGTADDLAAFDARLKILLIEHQVAAACEERHTAGALHYDLKITGGIPFPPFALASGEFPALTVHVEWVDAASGVRGAATIARGALTEQKVENVGAAACHAVAIRAASNGLLELALVAIRTGRDECRGYMLSSTQDALFRIVRDPTDGVIGLYSTEGAAEWSRAWRVPVDGAPEYRAIDPAEPIADSDFRDLEKLAQDFVAQWIWFGNGPREEIAIEAERYARAGYVVADANLRSAALHRIKSGDGAVRHSTLVAEIAWIEEVIARCWTVKP